jgi:hypothetical protein
LIPIDGDITFDTGQWLARACDNVVELAFCVQTTIEDVRIGRGGAQHRTSAKREERGKQDGGEAP